MEFIEKISERKYKIKSEESSRDYLMQTCSYFNILDSFSDDIIINVDSIEGLGESLKTTDEGLKITKFVYCIGLQMLILLDFNLSIKYFDESDFLYINNDLFLFSTEVTGDNSIISFSLLIPFWMAESSASKTSLSPLTSSAFSLA